MRLIVLANNRLGVEVLRWLKQQPDQIVGLVVHTKEKGRFREEIISESGLPKDCIFEGPMLNYPSCLNNIKELRPHMGISVLFGYILKMELIDIFPNGCLNIHPAYLPFNRGAYPNVWSIIDRTPAGATIHYIDVGVDTGDIVAQREEPIYPEDTGESLYRRLEKTCLKLFKETWPLVREGKGHRVPQNHELATTHRIQDVERIDCIDLDRSYFARKLIDILRARSYPPFRGAFFVEKGRKIFLELKLLPELTREKEEE